MAGARMNTDELLELLKRLHAEQDQGLRECFDRSLPFQDGTFDRWERAKRLGFGEGASIYNSSLVYGDVRVGEQTWIGPNTLLDGSGGQLTIGAYCSISSGVHIYSHDTVLWALSGGEADRLTAPVTIGDCVYIGPQSVIVAGVSIGDHCVVGANSFVNRDVEPRTVVAGSPARPIGRVVGEGKDVRIVTDDNS
jgi:acetyltransferase-like isoleucine patch superfamily enzyme